VHGVWSVSGSQLELQGRFCDSLYSRDEPDCAQGADFREERSLTGRDGWLIFDEALAPYRRVYLQRGN
jgi:hypothetical protein